MGYLVGIDIGTSSSKSIVMGEDGQILGLCQEEYSFLIPQEGWAEQPPEMWWQAVSHTILGAIQEAGIAPTDISGVGLSGQMHGAVLLDEKGEPVYNGVVWCDQRSIGEVEEINQILGKERLGAITFNPIAAGFQTATMLWMKKHRPDCYDRTRYLLSPKDYIRYRLTGELGTEPTDASATGAFDTGRLQWSEEILNALGLNRDMYVDVYPTSQVAGKVTAQAAQDTGLAAGTPVVFGGGDQSMQAVGNGIVHPGQTSCTIGTGGQILTPIDRPLYDPQLRTHTFAHADGKWFAMGATLSAGLSLKWLRDKILEGYNYATFSERAQKIPAGSGGLLFLPYLGGERTPHLDPYARGTFFGLTHGHTRDHMMRAVMEGVVFSLRDCIGVLEEMGISVGNVIASGGGARSDVWLQIQADILQKEIYVSDMLEQACVGAAIVAGVGVGVYSTLDQALERIVRLSSTPHVPDAQSQARYQELYGIYRELYRQTKDTMRALGQF